MKTKESGIAIRDTASLAKAVDALLPEIRVLIEEARHRAVTAANLSMVTLYWNIGKVLTQNIQRNPRRADYGEGLLLTLAERLIREYGPGFSRANLQDMRRFHDVFEICQPAAGKSLPAEIRQPLAGKSSSALIPQPVAVKTGERLLVDFAKHFHLGWTHYRILLGIADARQRRFYFEQACTQRWSKRERSSSGWDCRAIPAPW
jgi:hypothetical protein